MIERLLETWLNKANERSFQIPFAHWLAYTGHTVVHVSRHCAMELGKDILAIAPDGVPCAYQLKGIDGERLTLRKWREELGTQLHTLVHGRIVHPSISTTQPHRAYVVVNADLDEEVQREIDDFNRRNAEEGHPERQLRSIVRGELFQAFKDLQSDFWATNLYDIKTYLELFLLDGRGQLPKSKLATLLYDALPFESEAKPSTAEITRSVAGAAVICGAVTSSFTQEKNHVAEFEAWCLLWCHTAGIATRWRIDKDAVSDVLSLATEGMYTALARLCDELRERNTFTEGDPVIDRPLYRVRLTHLLGLMALYGLWMQSKKRCAAQEVDNEHLEFAIEFCESHFDKLFLWGEYAVPQFLAWYFFRQTYDSHISSDCMIGTLVESLTYLNKPDGETPLFNPYYDAEACLPHLYGLSKEPLNESFAGSSYYLEGLMHLFVRSNLKQRLRITFPDVTRIGFRSFLPEQPWQFFRYSNEASGTDVERFLTPPHRWSELQELAKECSGNDLPEFLRHFPLHYLAILLVMPHRVNSSGLRWLATEMDSHASDKSWL